MVNYWEDMLLALDSHINFRHATLNNLKYDGKYYIVELDGNSCFVSEDKNELIEAGDKYIKSLFIEINNYLKATGRDPVNFGFDFDAWKQWVSIMRDLNLDIDNHTVY